MEREKNMCGKKRVCVKKMILWWHICVVEIEGKRKKSGVKSGIGIRRNIFWKMILEEIWRWDFVAVVL